MSGRADRCDSIKDLLATVVQVRSARREVGIYHPKTTKMVAWKFGSEVDHLHSSARDDSKRETDTVVRASVLGGDEDHRTLPAVAIVIQPQPPSENRV